MASTTTAVVSEKASENALVAASDSPLPLSIDAESESTASVPDLSVVPTHTELTSRTSLITTDASPILPPVDACNVPLPDDECDQDQLEVTPPADHEATTPESDNVELAKHEPTDLDTTDRDQDDTQPDDVNPPDTSFALSSSAPTSPKTPKRQNESFSDSGDHHGSNTSSLSSIDSSPKTPAKESSSSDPFVVEDSTKGLSLDNIDMSSPNWMDNIANFLEKLEQLEPDTEELLEDSTLDKGKSTSAETGEDEEYDGPIIAMPDTPDYHPFSSNFQVRLSKFGGFGTFATRDLKLGEVILIEKPLLRTPRDSFYTDFRKLSEEDQEKYMQLYTPHGDYLSRDGSDYNHIRAILKANSFAINPYSNDIISVYNVASRLNHACQPVANVVFDFDVQNSDAIILTISKLVKAGSELFISYGGSPLSLYERYGFRCCCGGCEGVTDQELTIMKKVKNVEKYLWGL